MPHKDSIRTILKFWPVAWRLALCGALAVLAATLFYRGQHRTNDLSRTFDEIFGFGAVVLGAIVLLSAVWLLLVVRQQDRAPAALLKNPGIPYSHFEHPDDAIRRLSGTGEGNR